MGANLNSLLKIDVNNNNSVIKEIKKTNRKTTIKFTDLNFKTITSLEIKENKVKGYKYAF